MIALRRRAQGVRRAARCSTAIDLAHRRAARPSASSAPPRAGKSVLAQARVRPHRARRGGEVGRRRRRARRARRRAPHRHAVPEQRALRLHDRRRQRRLPARAPRRARRRRDPRARRASGCARSGSPAARRSLPTELSGGMKKRVGDRARRRSRARRSCIYDEPTAGLDPVTTSKIYDLLRAERDADRRHRGRRLVRRRRARASSRRDRACSTDGRLLYDGPAARHRRQRRSDRPPVRARRARGSAVKRAAGRAVDASARRRRARALRARPAAWRCSPGASLVAPRAAAARRRELRAQPLQDGRPVGAHRRAHRVLHRRHHGDPVGHLREALRRLRPARLGRRLRDAARDRARS